MVLKKIKQVKNKGHYIRNPHPLGTWVCFLLIGLIFVYNLKRVWHLDKMKTKISKEQWMKR